MTVITGFINKHITYTITKTRDTYGITKAGCSIKQGHSWSYIMAVKRLIKGNR